MPGLIMFSNITAYIIQATDLYNASSDTFQHFTKLVSIIFILHWFKLVNIRQLQFCRLVVFNGGEYSITTIHFFLCFLYHSRNDSLGGEGISLSLYQGFNL